ncbi:MAG: hydantoinase B/oxoprolinase family protein [Cyclobacteriaceae bacterium]|nr:hydantoinase B/oxoprolinase family protein [Cyclobacteriaceae bacterium]
MKAWQIWVDTGGTFTDCIAHTPQGDIRRLKVLSSGALKGLVVEQKSSRQLKVQLHWPVTKDIFENFAITFFDTKKTSTRIDKVTLGESIIHLSASLKHKIKPGTTFEISSREEVPVFATRLLTETSFKNKFPKIELKLGSTRGTNALLERNGAPTVLIITKGFKDLLLIGTQQRPDLFALNIVRPRPLYDSVIEVDERIETKGKVLKSLTKSVLQKLLKEIKKAKGQSMAIALLNSFENPIHEKLIKERLIKEGYNFVTASHEISGQIKILQRAETTVANAYLDPIIRTYVANIQAGLSQAKLKLMTSAGGLVDAASFFPKDSLLSGPAGGVAGAVTSAQLSKTNRIITFDMGGTSTDVSLYNNQYSYRYESKVGDIRILSPSLDIETIAAGGGSICNFDGYKLTVGPHSAGASPGPACYGSGGPLTITDVNLLLGRADADFFSIPLYKDKSEAALNLVIENIKSATGRQPTRETLLQSFIQIANEKMAEAIRKVSVQQGYDPADYALLSFGGAGGQHACSLAELLNMKKILVPYDAGLLSAYGIGHAQIEHFEERLLLQDLAVTEKSFEKNFQKLYRSGLAKLRKDGFREGEIEISKRLVFLRFKGQESSLEANFREGQSVKSEFKTKYKSIYGHWLSDREIEVESIRLILAVKQAKPINRRSRTNLHIPQSLKQTKIFEAERWRQMNVHRWENLVAGAIIKGPALIVSNNSTTVVDRYWTFRLDEYNNGILQNTTRSKVRAAHSSEASLELFSNRFTAVAQEMGALLQRTSFSVNVKERLDFSCAMMDAQGYLVVNAPHIPVHLGSMGVCVREVNKMLKMRAGDVVITNHPAFGGSHLPDVTLIKPVFWKKILIGYVATRAHHAEIGGKKPGSMPADAKTLEEEGIIITPTLLVARGKVRWDHIRKILTSGKYPTRLIEENLADLNGALAAVNRGESALQLLCLQYGASEVSVYMTALRNYAAALLQMKLSSVKVKSYQAKERLDDGSLLNVKLTIRKGGRLQVDFSGSAPVHAGNLNATKAIVQSVILYVLRLWVNQPIAMNEGLMEPVDIKLPVGLLNPDFSGKTLPAVVGGNTEVSQRLTDTLLKALGLVACSQGTMNNFLFGNQRFGFYETICGGTGAGPGFNGTDAIHSHMTNTRITDPEILEFRYPVRLERFEIRKNSGGEGRWLGGNGVVREISFKEKVEVNILSQHRVEKPYGLSGGSSGKPGKQRLISRKKVIPLKGMDNVLAEIGDRIIIETPGGGGYEKKRAPKK